MTVIEGEGKYQGKYMAAGARYTDRNKAFFVDRIDNLYDNKANSLSEYEKKNLNSIGKDIYNGFKGDSLKKFIEGHKVKVGIEEISVSTLINGLEVDYTNKNRPKVSYKGCEIGRGSEVAAIIQVYIMTHYIGLDKHHIDGKLGEESVRALFKGGGFTNGGVQAETRKSKDYKNRDLDTIIRDIIKKGKEKDFSASATHMQFTACYVINDYIDEMESASYFLETGRKRKIEGGKAVLTETLNKYKKEAIDYLKNERERMRKRTYDKELKGNIQANLRTIAKKIDKAENDAFEKIKGVCTPNQQNKNAEMKSEAKTDRHGEVMVDKKTGEVMKQEPIFRLDEKTGITTFTSRSNPLKIHQAFKGLFHNNYTYLIDYTNCKNEGVKQRMKQLIGGLKCHIRYDKAAKTYLIRGGSEGKVIDGNRALIREGVTLKRDETIKWEAYQVQQAKFEQLGKVDASINDKTDPENDPKLKDLAKQIPEDLRIKLKALKPSPQEYRKFIIKNEERIAEIIKQGIEEEYELQTEPVTKLWTKKGILEVHFINGNTKKDITVWEDNSVIGEKLYDLLDGNEEDYKEYLTKRVNAKMAELDEMKARKNYLEDYTEEELSEDELISSDDYNKYSFGIAVLNEYIENHRNTEGDSIFDGGDYALSNMVKILRNLEYTLKESHDRVKKEKIVDKIDDIAYSLAADWAKYTHLRSRQREYELFKNILLGEKQQQIAAIRKLSDGEAILDKTESTFIKKYISESDAKYEELEDENGKKIKVLKFKNELEVNNPTINAYLGKINNFFYAEIDYRDNNEGDRAGKLKETPQTLRIDSLYKSAKSDSTGSGIVKLLLERQIIPKSREDNDDVKEKCGEIAKALNQQAKVIETSYNINMIKSQEKQEKARLQAKSNKTEKDYEKLQAIMYLENHPDEANKYYQESLKMAKDELKYGCINNLIRENLMEIYVEEGGGAKGGNANIYNDIVGYGAFNPSDENAKATGALISEIAIMVAVSCLTAGIGGAVVGAGLRGLATGVRYARWVKFANNIRKATKVIEIGYKELSWVGKTVKLGLKTTSLLLEAPAFNAASTMVHSVTQGTSLDAINLNPIAKENIQTAAFLGALSIGNSMGMKAITKLHGRTKIQAFTEAGLKEIVKHHKGVFTRSLVSEATAMFGAEQGMNFVFGHDVIDPETGEINKERSFTWPNQQEWAQMIGMILAFKVVKPKMWHNIEKRLNKGTIEICRGVKKNQVLTRDVQTGEIQDIQDIINGKTGNSKTKNPRQETQRRKQEAENRKTELENRRAELERRRAELLKQRDENRKSLESEGNTIDQIDQILQKGNVVTIDGVKYKFNGVKNEKAQFVVDKAAKQSAEKSGKKVSDIVEVSSLGELADKTRFNLEPGNKSTNSGRYNKLNEILGENVEPLDRLKQKINNKKSEIKALEEEIARLEKGNNTTAYNDYFQAHKNELIGKSIWIDGVEYRATHQNKNGDIQFKQRDGNKNFTISSFKQLKEQGGTLTGFSDGEMKSDGSFREDAKSLNNKEKDNHEAIQKLIEGERSYLESRNIQESINQKKAALEQTNHELKGLEDKLPSSQSRQETIDARAKRGAEINKELGKIENELGKVGNELDNTGRAIQNRDRELAELNGAEQRENQERERTTDRTEDQQKAKDRAETTDRAGEQQRQQSETVSEEMLADEFDTKVNGEGITINGDTYRLEYRENTTQNRNRKGEYVWTKNGEVVRSVKAETRTLPDNADGNHIKSEYTRLRSEYIKQKTKDLNRNNPLTETRGTTPEEQRHTEETRQVEKSLQDMLNYQRNEGNLKLDRITQKMFETGVFIEGVHNWFKNLSSKPSMKLPRKILKALSKKIGKMKAKWGNKLSDYHQKLVDKYNEYIKEKLSKNEEEIEIRGDEIEKIEIREEDLLKHFAKDQTETIKTLINKLGFNLSTCITYKTYIKNLKLSEKQIKNIKRIQKKFKINITPDQLYELKDLKLSWKQTKNIKILQDTLGADINVYDILFIKDFTDTQISNIINVKNKLKKVGIDVDINHIEQVKDLTDAQINNVINAIKKFQEAGIPIKAYHIGNVKDLTDAQINNVINAINKLKKIGIKIDAYYTKQIKDLTDVQLNNVINASKKFQEAGIDINAYHIEKIKDLTDVQLNNVINAIKKFQEAGIPISAYNIEQTKDLTDVQINNVINASNKLKEIGININTYNIEHVKDLTDVQTNNITENIIKLRVAKIDLIGLNIESLKDLKLSDSDIKNFKKMSDELGNQISINNIKIICENMDILNIEDKNFYNGYEYSKEGIESHQHYKRGTIIETIQQHIQKTTTENRDITEREIINEIRTLLIKLPKVERLDFLTKIPDLVKKFNTVRKYIDFNNGPYKSAKELLLAIRGIKDPKIIEKISEDDITVVQHGVGVNFFVGNERSYQIIYDKSLKDSGDRSGGFNTGGSEIKGLEGTLSVTNGRNPGTDVGNYSYGTKFHEGQHNRNNYFMYEKESNEPIRRAKDEITAYLRDGRGIYKVEKRSDTIEKILTKPKSKGGLYHYDLEGKDWENHKAKVKELLSYANDLIELTKNPKTGVSRDRVISMLSDTPADGRKELHSIITEAAKLHLERNLSQTKIQRLRESFISKIKKRTGNNRLISNLVDFWNSMFPKNNINLKEFWWAGTAEKQTVVDRIFEEAKSIEDVKHILNDPQYDHIQRGPNRMGGIEISDIINDVVAGRVGVDYIPPEIRPQIKRFLRRGSSGGDTNYFNGKSHQFEVTETQTRENSRRMDKILKEINEQNKSQKLQELREEISRQYKEATGEELELTDEQLSSILNAHHEKKGKLGELTRPQIKEKVKTLYETIKDDNVRRFLLEAGFCGKETIGGKKLKVELEISAATSELKELYKKKYRNLTKEEHDRVDRLEKQIQQQGILVARSPAIETTKISMLAKSEPREAFIPDFTNEAQLIEVGFQKGKDGKWYHTNRDWYPNALSETDVVYIFKRDANGKPIDTGFGPNHELSTMYVRTEDFDANKINFIKAQEMTPGKVISVKKCASGTFCILPVGTKLFTSEGIVEVKLGEIVNIKEGQNSIHTSRIVDVPDMYKADPLNPASKQLFDLINEYKIKEPKLSKTKKIEFQDEIADVFGRINRGQKLCEILGENEIVPKTLKEEYEMAAKITKELDTKYISKIDVSDFNNALKQAREVLDEIYKNPELTPIQKEAAKMAVMVRLLPKTNAHQHLKGSLPKDVTLDLARQKGFTEEQIRAIEESYSKGENGYDNLNDFNISYGTIGRPVSTPADYEYAIRGIIREAMKQGQLTTEIRCACDSLKNEKGEYLSPEEGAEAIIQAIENVKREYESQGLQPPKTGFVFLSYRGRDRDGSLKSAVTQAKEAVKAATKHPDMKFGFDVAGPEDTGYGPKYFKEAIDIIKEHNAKVESGEIKAEKIDITMHAGETPTFDGGRPGYLSVEEAIEMGVDRIGHGVQAITNPETMQKLKDSGITVEICGVCNIQSIPVNTEGLKQHPIDSFIDKDIPVTICTDNDAICGTNISKEYLQFLLTGHSNFMDWNNVKQSARDGIQSAFISEKDKISATQTLENRINQIQRLINEFDTHSTKIEQSRNKNTKNTDYFNGKSRKIFKGDTEKAELNSKTSDRILQEINEQNKSQKLQELREEITEQYKQTTGEELQLSNEQLLSILDAHEQDGELGKLKLGELKIKVKILSEAITDEKVIRFLLEAGFCGQESVQINHNTELENINSEIIEDQTFIRNKNINEINLSRTKEIGNGSFWHCINLEKISISEELKTIGRYGFSDTGLTEIVLPKSLKEIGENAFADCKNLERVSFNQFSQIDTIKEQTFMNCSKLKKINIPTSILSICKQAFENCISLEEIIISNPLCQLEHDIFKGCKNLKRITIPETYKGKEDYLGIPHNCKINYISVNQNLKNLLYDNNGKIKENVEKIVHILAKFGIPEYDIPTILEKCKDYKELSSFLNTIKNKMEKEGITKNSIYIIPNPQRTTGTGNYHREEQNGGNTTTTSLLNFCLMNNGQYLQIFKEMDIRQLICMSRTNVDRVYFNQEIYQDFLMKNMPIPDASTNIYHLLKRYKGSASDILNNPNYGESNEIEKFLSTHTLSESMEVRRYTGYYSLNDLIFEDGLSLYEIMKNPEKYKDRLGKVSKEFTGKEFINKYFSSSSVNPQPQVSGSVQRDLTLEKGVEAYPLDLIGGTSEAEILINRNLRRTIEEIKIDGKEVIIKAKISKNINKNEREPNENKAHLNTVM